MLSSLSEFSQQLISPDKEIWSPEPRIVKPGKFTFDAPSDAIILFDGKNLDEWESSKDHSLSAQWIVSDGTMTVNKKVGDIQTKKKFIDYQLHVEWLIPVDIAGKDQSRGNSGIFLVSISANDYAYELQVLDSYQNKTYVNGQAGAIYKQYAPLVNASRKPGEWQSFDMVWKAPRFHDDGTLKRPARMTAFHNNILIQDNVELRPPLSYPVDDPDYKKRGSAAIRFQAHGDPSAPISYRNIWVRNL